ncbi:type 4 prepilin peptidase 1 [Idiomarina aquatica]|uniref:Prepilin leader peptidase/N-methyltransferase n=1 Tax=Idiomarina aquatica TaxID=1327752 RepID=A0A4V3CN46_9GAMM|nr:A24 family peptidase [Idiomarina aquatica]TDP32672.1 type 4 prepilin peptidase 1 [Idiomarina aquatica]
METLYAAGQWPAVLIGILLGACVGSFLNVVIVRLPKQLQQQWQRECAELNGQPVKELDRYNLAHPPSHCPQCQHRIAWYDNIPLLSYVVLMGRCRHCRDTIPVVYWLVELLMTAVIGYAAWTLGITLTWLVLLVATALLVAMVVIDTRHQLLPDQLTYCLLWLGLLWSISGQSAITPTTALIGAAAGYLSLWLVYWAFKLLTGKEGLGYGDFKLLAAIGAFTGATLLPVTILASSLVGIVVGVIAMLKRGYSAPIPFGPFLIGGGLISYFYGNELLLSYWQWIGF